MEYHKRTNELPVDSTTKSKRQRRCLTIEDKIKLLDRLKAGERTMDLSREYEISDSTIRSLISSESQIRKYARQCTKYTYRSVAYIPRDEVQAKMEHELYVWYEDQLHHGGTQSVSSICAKAREIYRSLKGKKEVFNCGKSNRKSDEELQLDSRDFKASKSWFVKFRKRYNLEFNTPHIAQSVDQSICNLYAAKFSKLMQTENYQPCQVFSAFELSFAWKSLPSHTFIAKEDKSRDKMGYDHISLLICNNAQGNFCVKPMLIHRTRMPHCLRNTKISDLPVFWRCRGRQTQSSPKVTPSHFHDWLIQCFTPRVRNYLQIMEMPERCVLLLSSELQQMVLPTYDESFLRVEFLPENTAQLLHPIAQSVLPIFHCKYLRRFFEHLVQSLEVKTESDLYKVWQKYSIAHAIDNIHESLEDINVESWKSGWYQLWSKIGIEPSHNSLLADEITHITINGRQLPGDDFADMTIEDIKQHLKLGESITNNEPETQTESTQQIKYEKSAERPVQIENEELISLCSDTQSEDADIIINQGIKEVSENEIYIQFADSDDEVHEFEQSDEEAFIQFHQTEDSNEYGSKLRMPTRSNNTTLAKKNTEAREQIQIINKAFDLTHDLLETLGQLEAQTNLTHFESGLNNLMQPYVELKKKLLQPSIKDYFS
ncbi:tigger transposable element-derived protein 1 isoform X1 [Zeugodacus cucurbitae]|uniref:Tigger transposable element-derived protein 1 n=1 Tax=Zeugodacus cucurbitae TaxID=28588 RepID=A0A0A1X4S0_ZEUCU|nr:tigger transposable element-derived protein 1 isoform X1 [Zeugodacus cucurbitae]XP_054081800.1 tigger transposable element-derived protein 1 isoform X1 [Zeugodacus cucurbitae]